MSILQPHIAQLRHQLEAAEHDASELDAAYDAIERIRRLVWLASPQEFAYFEPELEDLLDDFESLTGCH